jgi:two-component system cell cycle sensor histidine kinase/response regulator CckA
MRDGADKDARQSMLAGVAHQMPALIWVTDRDLRVRHTLGAGLLQFDDVEQFRGKTLYEFFETEYLNFPPIAAHRAALHGQRRTYPYRLGELRLEVVVEPLRGEDGTVVGTLGIATDVSTRDQIEERLRLLSTAVESAAHAIAVTDREGRFTWVNAAFSELTGYSLDEVLGQNPRILKSGRHERQIYEELWKTILSGQVWKGELINRRKDGSLYTEAQSIAPVFDADGEISHFISFKHDLTEAKEMEEQFRQAQKMEAVGRLAGGVAHDFNNLLTAIMGYSELLLADFHVDDPRHSDITAIKKAADRASALTRQLLAFSRRQVLQPKVLDLNATISGMAKLLQRLIGEDVELLLALDETLGRTKADPGQIEQVIMNLAVNARDAMPGGGKLTIETGNIILDGNDTKKHPRAQSGPYVMLSVRDTGEGMDKETQRRIFEPFFTTKEVGKGTGLGLSTIYGIVKQSGGTICLHSEPGNGTTFKIYLPRTDEDSSIPISIPSEESQDHIAGPIPPVSSVGEPQKK